MELSILRTYESQFFVERILWKNLFDPSPQMDQPLFTLIVFSRDLQKSRVQLNLHRVRFKFECASRLVRF
jgi:hypothetical protein